VRADCDAAFDKRAIAMEMTQRKKSKMKKIILPSGMAAAAFFSNFQFFTEWL